MKLGKGEALARCPSCRTLHKIPQDYADFILCPEESGEWENGEENNLLNSCYVHVCKDCSVV